MTYNVLMWTLNPTHSLTHSGLRRFTNHLLTYLFTYLYTYLLIHSLARLLARSLTNLLTYILTYLNKSGLLFCIRTRRSRWGRVVEKVPCCPPVSERTRICETRRRCPTWLRATCRSAEWCAPGPGPPARPRGRRTCPGLESPTTPAHATVTRLMWWVLTRQCSPLSSFITHSSSSSSSSSFICCFRTSMDAMKKAPRGDANIAHWL